jgi:hypothetical protein
MDTISATLEFLECLDLRCEVAYLATLAYLTAAK